MEYKDKMTNSYFADRDFVMKIINGGWNSDKQAKTVFNVYLNFTTKWSKKGISLTSIYSTTLINMVELIKDYNSKHNYTLN